MHAYGNTSLTGLVVVRYRPIQYDHGVPVFSVSTLHEYAANYRLEIGIPGYPSKFHSTDVQGAEERKGNKLIKG